MEMGWTHCPKQITIDGQQEQWIGNQRQGKGRWVDREEGGEMTSWHYLEQY